MTIENAKTTIINLNDKEKRIILIIFNPRKFADTDKHTAEVYTTYEDYATMSYQFGIGFDYGKESEIVDMVINNYNNGNIVWETDDK